MHATPAISQQALEAADPVPADDPQIAHTAVELVTLPHADPARPLRAAGAIVMDGFGNTGIILAENVVFAVGGPGGLYQASVYPACHTGGIGLALEAGARAQSLPESQFGLASTAFRWNVSGSYMQVIPRVVSTAADGRSDPREFLTPWFDAPGEAFSRLFLKGYQWPFDTRKLAGGSSLNRANGSDRSAYPPGQEMKYL